MESRSRRQNRHFGIKRMTVPNAGWLEVRVMPGFVGHGSCGEGSRTISRAINNREIRRVGPLKHRKA
jgi:hypothetical protein